MHHGHRARIGMVAQRSALLDGALHQVEIVAQIDGREPAERLKIAFPEHQRVRAGHVVEHVQLHIVLRLRVYQIPARAGFDEAAVLVHERQILNAHVRVFFADAFVLARELVRQVPVVVVQKGQIFARGQRRGMVAVARRAEVLFVHDVPRAVFRGDARHLPVPRQIGVVVGNQNFDVRVRLRAHGRDRRFQALVAPVGADDHGNSAHSSPPS